MSGAIRHQAGARIAGQKTGGQFKAHERAAAAPPVTQSAAPGPGEIVTATVRYEQCDLFNNAITVGVDDAVDLTALFDHLPLNEVPEEIGSADGDHYFYEAQERGLVPSHDGPFSLEVDSDLLADYRARREALGQVDRGVPCTARFQDRAAAAKCRISDFDDQLEQLHRERKKAAHSYVGASLRAHVPDAVEVIVIRSDTDDVSYAPDCVYEISGVISERSGELVFTDLSEHTGDFSELQTLLDQSPQYFDFEELPDTAPEYETIATPWDGDLMRFPIEG